MTQTAHSETLRRPLPEPFRSPAPRIRALLDLIEPQASAGPIRALAKEWLAAHDALCRAIDRTDAALTDRTPVDDLWAAQQAAQEPFMKVSSEIAFARPTTVAEAAIKLQVLLDMESVEALDHGGPLLTVVDELIRLAAH